MFPNGWPGSGLLILRAASGILLIGEGIAGLTGETHRVSLALLLLAAASGIFLLVGLWTPVAGVLVAIAELAIVFLGSEHPQSDILLAAVAASIAMLGPGMWSIDAHLFGRQRLDVRER